MKFDKQFIVFVATVVGVFIVTRFTANFYAYVVFGKQAFQNFPLYEKVLWVHLTNLVICFVATFFLANRSWARMLDMLGLSGSGFLPGLIFGFIAALPQLIGQIVLHGIKHDLTFMDIWIYGIHPGYHEEIFFRAFLIGLLVRYVRVPFLIPLVVSSLVFGMGHLYQAHSFSESTVVFLSAFGVGIGFYLFYKYSGWNLWFPLFLHSFMDSATTLANFSGNITMSTNENLYRGSTILLGILYCVYYQIKIKKSPVL